MVVAVGLTETATPLVTAVLPGVITPAPLANTAVMLELDPASIAAGLAAKLVMEGVVEREDEVLEHPANPTKPRLRATAHAAGTKRCLKGFPVRRN